MTAQTETPTKETQNVSPPPPRFNRTLAYVLLLVLAGGAGFAAYWNFWYTTRPPYRFNVALQAIKDRDFKKLRHEAIVLDEVPGYEPHFHYLMGMWRLGTAQS